MYDNDCLYGRCPEGVEMKNVITCLTVSVLSGVTFATTWTVDDDGKADFDNIQAAVDASSDGDEIIVYPGTYTSTSDYVVNMLGKQIWLHSSKGAGVTIIDGEDTHRGILCNSSETLNTSIEGFTVTNGNAYIGGGMYIGDGSSPALTDCTFENNWSGYYGGGMYNSGNPTLTNCTFTNNMAYSAGGGMSTSGSPTLENCTFINNSLFDSPGGTGGGGMYIGDGSSPALTDCTFENNTATQYGGGMYNMAGSSPTLTDCTFENNTAIEYDGGGMYNREGSSPTLENCTFKNNGASRKGGGMYNYCGGSYPLLTDCTFTNNYSELGGGIWNVLQSSPTLTNNSICENSPDQIFGDWHGEGNIVSEVCPWNQGACCTNGNCLVSEQENCLAFFGQWQGEGTTCVENPCPTSCLGDLNSDGQVNVNDLMIMIAYWGAPQ
jgi:parallel beta-helix repeat protein